MSPACPCFIRTDAPLRGLVGNFPYLAAGDWDRTRLQCLGYFTLQCDMEQSIRELGALDPNMIRKIEAALECALGDTAVQKCPFGIVRIGF